MTIAPDREDLTELDRQLVAAWEVPADIITPLSRDEQDALDQVEHARVEVMRQIIDQVATYPDHYHSPYQDRDWYCYCSPSRGQALGLYQQTQQRWEDPSAPEHRGARAHQLLMDEHLALTYSRWVPDEPSTAVAVREPEVEVAHDWDGFLTQLVAGVLASVVLGMVACVSAVTLLHLG